MPFAPQAGAVPAQALPDPVAPGRDGWRSPNKAAEGRLEGGRPIQASVEPGLLSIARHLRVQRVAGAAYGQSGALGLQWRDKRTASWEGPCRGPHSTPDVEP